MISQTHEIETQVDGLVGSTKVCQQKMLIALIQVLELIYSTLDNWEFSSHTSHFHAY